MPTSTNVTNLKINELTEAQYDTAVQNNVIGANELSIITDMDIDAIQVSTMPTAAVGELGKVYQFIGTTDASYTHGYFYECVSDGAVPPVYSWSQLNVQPGGSSLPSQTGNSGKFLTTDGTDASWSDKPLVNTATGTNSLTVGGVASTYNQVINIGSLSQAYSYSNVLVGYNTSAYSTSVAIGISASAGGDYPYQKQGNVSIGYVSRTRGNYSIALGYSAKADADGAIQISATSVSANQTNEDANTFKVGNANGNFEIMSADGTIPADRLPNAINKYSTMPTADSTNVGWIVQFTGTTDSTYTHGYIYECKAQGTNPETYAWEAVEVQAGGGGGLPDPTGHAWKYLTNDGTTASWSNYSPLTNQADKKAGLTWSVFVNPQGGNLNSAGSYSVGLGASDDVQGGYAIGVGISAKTRNTGSIAVGYSAETRVGTSYGIAIGYEAKVHNNCSYGIQLGRGTNSSANTFYVGLSSTNNYRLLDSDGTIPADRLASTTGLADGNYRLRLTMASGVPTLSWVAE